MEFLRHPIDATIKIVLKQILCQESKGRRGAKADDATRFHSFNPLCCGNSQHTEQNKGKQSSNQAGGK